MEIPPVMGIVIHPRIESHTFERLIQEFGEFVYFFFSGKNSSRNCVAFKQNNLTRKKFGGRFAE